MKTKTIYTCPMHPEIRQDHPGKCPKCGGMDLIPEAEVAGYNSTHPTETTSYKPLFTVVSLILLTALVLTYRDWTMGMATLAASIEYFMIGFFLVFAGFKLVDLKGFAEGYSTYDLLAGRWPTYGYIYPFIELFFAFAMMLHWQQVPVLIAEIIIMTFSGIGVAIKIAKKEKFQCACLGTFLKVPLTNVTLVEDFGMAALAAVLLILNFL